MLRIEQPGVGESQVGKGSPQIGGSGAGNNAAGSTMPLKLTDHKDDVDSETEERM